MSSSDEEDDTENLIDNDKSKSEQNSDSTTHTEADQIPNKSSDVPKIEK